MLHMNGGNMINKLTVVMLVGGRGSRLAPYTDNLPKCLVDIQGKTLLERILDNLQPLFTGFTVNYVFLVNYLGEQVEEYVNKYLDLDAVFLYDKPNSDQVSVVLEAKPFVTDAMLLYYGDTIIFINEYIPFPSQQFAFIDYVDDVSRFGYIDDTGLILEKPEALDHPGYVVVGGVFFPIGKLYFDRHDKLKKHGFMSTTIGRVAKVKVKNHISIDTPEDWIIANKYYKENEK